MARNDVSGFLIRAKPENENEGGIMAGVGSIVPWKFIEWLSLVSIWQLFKLIKYSSERDLWINSSCILLNYTIIRTLVKFILAGRRLNSS